MGGGVSDLWVTVKAKTTCKRTRAVLLKKRWAFRASLRGVTIGSDHSCAIPIEDGSMAGEHARIGLDEQGNVTLRSSARTYYLLGQGPRPDPPRRHQLEKDHVVKMGACSLQVTDLCIAKRNVVPVVEIT
jgi:hypothetical protein